MVHAEIIFWTCKKEVHGLDAFVKTAKEHPCILMLWHNNLIIVPEIVHTFANQFIFYSIHQQQPRR